MTGEEAKLKDEQRVGSRVAGARRLSARRQQPMLSLRKTPEAAASTRLGW